MRVPSRSRASLAFNITPLIDVVFLLIIFFLVSTHVVQSEVRTKVELPEASSIENESKPAPRRIVITIKDDGVYIVNEQEWPLTRIEAAIKDGAGDDPAGFEVIMRIDKPEEFRHIKPIHRACAAAGVRLTKYAVYRK